MGWSLPRCAETFRQGAVSPCHASSDRRFSSHFGSGISGFVGNAHGMTYFVTERTWAIGLQWFVIMIPFATLLSPVVIFLFNFAAESFVILQKRLKA